ncbi:hypothetical protein SAMN02745126_03750 [Enhydrobacter aerosaccus]|uniref:Uncharacterized protein n=1 Tax=Enhydrobacter aerosaccus TaxID=225324 RepID=A0A1T4RBM2_9HYPH|nr:hypothetical protein [Enhydrobacter aerosaccus]SKA13307.1 hypothetical protein SAMN02745126_03750 [Enhydrobacter aerosaccus]
MTTQRRRFILQAIHPDYGCPAFETLFTVDRLEELQSLLGEGAKDDPDLRMHYRLEPEEAIAIAKRFAPGFEANGRVAYLDPWAGDRETPYLLHGGYELVLMLDGRKPFARMGTYRYPPERFPGEELFDVHVALGRLHKEVMVEPFLQPDGADGTGAGEGFRTVFYTLKGEEWRIPAWKLASKATGGEGWNDTLERLEGLLLGYEDWQNDWHIGQRRARQRKFGTSLVYLAVTAEELETIRTLGFRALPSMGRSLDLVSAFDEEPDDQEPRRLMEAQGRVALVRVRVNTRSFLDLVEDKRQRFHRLPEERLKDLNLTLVEPIEIVSHEGR